MKISSSRRDLTCNLSRQLCVLLLVFTTAMADPGMIPERIILNLTDQPATSMAVTWRTPNPVESPQAQITITADSVNFGARAKTVTAQYEKKTTKDSLVLHYYSVVFDGLAPATSYSYRVGCPEYWAEWSEFSTADSTPESFQFVYFGDPQNNIRSMCSRMFRTAYTMAPKASFWHFVGDIVDWGESDANWGDFYYALGWIPRETPFILLPGNHESFTIIDDKFVLGELTELWRPQFTLPENGPEGLEETAYYIDYQGVRFVMLNGNEQVEAQAQWLEGVLKSNRQKWTIVSIHQPAYSMAYDRKNIQVKELLVPLFDRFKVDLVLQGHDHTYGRTHPLNGGTVTEDDEFGTVYVVSVTGTKTYPLKPESEAIMAKTGVGIQLFQLIEIDGDLLSYRSVTASGKSFDSFILQK